MEQFLEMVAHICAILTFVVAAGGYFKYRYDFYCKRRKLEIYLEEAGKKAKSRGKKGQFTFLHLMKHVGLTEDEILQSSFKSQCIERFTVPDASGLSEELLFGFRE
ncbi:MAG: hypothetical protein OXR68_06450 [Alphaproteobacteria bacterium]|nr:hypothetical protein [Alphaproteobacteria bacterium]MDD9920244.1 hypothetical protein [Alphaproteobacteria bacterium]